MMYSTPATGLAYFNSGARVMNYSAHKVEAVSCSKLLVVGYQTTQHAGSEDCKRQRFWGWWGDKSVLVSLILTNKYDYY
jgi:hypothetical protein